MPHPPGKDPRIPLHRAKGNTLFEMPDTPTKKVHPGTRGADNDAVVLFFLFFVSLCGRRGRQTTFQYWHFWLHFTKLDVGFYAQRP